MDARSAEDAKSRAAEAAGARLAEDVERRYRLVREAAEADGLDAVLVCATEYTGFEGDMFYLSGVSHLH